MQKKRGTMWPTFQRTIRREVVIDGVGTHKGKKSSIIIRPSLPHSGICFVTKKGRVSANISNLGEVNSNTTLDGNGVKVETVEHLLSCLYGLFISNAEVEIHGSELPIGDGSARHFYDSIMSVGVEDQEKYQRIGIVVTKTAKVKESDSRFISISPAKKLIIKCSLNWHKNITGEYTYSHEQDNYSDIAYARTFGERKYVKALRKKGLAIGTKFGENCIDIDGDEKVAEECIKHKILDILGDISLLYGFYLLGKITAVNSSHKLHHELIKRMLAK